MIFSCGFSFEVESCWANRDRQLRASPWFGWCRVGQTGTGSFVPVPGLRGVVLGKPGQAASCQSLVWAVSCWANRDRQLRASPWFARSRVEQTGTGSFVPVPGLRGVVLGKPGQAASCQSLVWAESCWANRDRQLRASPWFARCRVGQTGTGSFVPVPGLRGVVDCELEGDAGE